MTVISSRTPWAHDLESMEGGSGLLEEIQLEKQCSCEDNNGRTTVTRPARIPWRRDCLKLGVCFSLSLSTLVLLLRYVVFQGMSADDKALLTLPMSLADAKVLAQVLGRFKKDHMVHLVFGQSLCYIWLQAFSIPGTLFTNLVGGALFGVWAFPLHVFLSTVGSVACYTIYGTLGRRPLEKLFPQRLDQCRRLLAAQKGDITMYLTLLFVFPVAPHWFIKATASIFDIQLTQFVPAVCVGLMPYNYITSSAGYLLASLASQNDIFDSSTTTLLAVVSLAGVLAVLAKRHSLLPTKRAASKGLQAL
jgi:uncharacterized membrane protein YdjX (TVP38/TMEM64 family)